MAGTDGDFRDVIESDDGDRRASVRGGAITELSVSIAPPATDGAIADERTSGDLIKSTGCIDLNHVTETVNECRREVLVIGDIAIP
tara:strand:+ start:294 stop:551 length:258 start_codon:yes stop_codon:yes gene_type:complete